MNRLGATLEPADVDPDDYAAIYYAGGHGTPLVKGKQVTGFSNEEERLAELDRFVPFLTEDELVARGAVYRKAERPWAPFAVADRRVVTGQNPASGAAVAELVLEALAKA